MSARISILGAAALSTALVGLCAAPGSAATAGSAEATALEAVIGGTAAGAGSYTAANSGDGEQTNGRNQPVVPPLLTQQGALTAGTLFQDATARDDGSTAACAGLAGEGATLVQVGEGTSCFRDAGNASLSLAEVDLGGLTADLPPELRDALGPLADPLQQQLDQVVGQLPGGGVYVDLTGIESQCKATPARGDSTFADVRVRGRFGDQDIDVLSLRNRYAPNTTLPVDLQAFYDRVLADVETALTNGLDGQTGPLAELPAQLRNQAIQDALAQIGSQLQPLADNAITLTLNKQERGDRSITVTAVDLEVLPAANGPIGGQALALDLGRVTCSARTLAEPAPTPQPKPKPKPRPAPHYPTHVPAGQAGEPDDEGWLGLLGVTGIVVLAAGGLQAARRER